MRSNFERLRVYRLSERIADQIWALELGWDAFARKTVGQQLVRTADSIGANIAEGEGRGSYADNKRFVRTARGSLNETKHFLRPLLDELAPRLNGYLKSIGRSTSETTKSSGAATDH